MTELPSRDEMQATIDYAVTRTPLDGADAKLIAFARHWVSGRLVDRETIDYEAATAWLYEWSEGKPIEQTQGMVWDLELIEDITTAALAIVAAALGGPDE